jgi:hypothetical protein
MEERKMDFWKGYEKRLKKEGFSQQFYDILKHLFSKMTVKNFLKMYPEEWADRINATQVDSCVSEEDAIAVHKIATDLYSELLFDERIEKKQKEYDELSNKLKKLQEQQLAEVKTIGRDKPNDDYAKWQIKGYVYEKETNRPIEGFTVRAFISNNLKEDEYIGKAQTGPQGRFVIQYRKTDFKKNFLESLSEDGPDIILRIYNQEGKLIETTPKRSGASRFEKYSIEISISGLKLPQNLSNSSIDLLLPKGLKRELLTEIGIKTLGELSLINVERIAMIPRVKEVGFTIFDLKRLKTRARITILADKSSQPQSVVIPSGYSIPGNIQEIEVAFRTFLRLFPSKIALQLSSAGVADISTLLNWDTTMFQKTISYSCNNSQEVSREVQRFERFKDMVESGHEIEKIDGLTVDILGSTVIPAEDVVLLAQNDIATLEDWAIANKEIKVSNKTSLLLNGLTRLGEIGIWGDDAIKLIDEGIDSAATLVKLSKDNISGISRKLKLKPESINLMINAAKSKIIEAKNYAEKRYNYSTTFRHNITPFWPNIIDETDSDLKEECIDCPTELSAYSRFAYYVYLVSCTEIPLNKLEIILNQDLINISHESDKTKVAQIDLCVEVLTRALQTTPTFEENFEFLWAKLSYTLQQIRNLPISDIVKDLLAHDAFSSFGEDDLEAILEGMKNLPTETPNQYSITSDQVTILDELFQKYIYSQIYGDVSQDGAFIHSSPEDIEEETQHRIDKIHESIKNRNIIYLRKALKVHSGLTDEQLFDKYFIETNLDPCVQTTRLTQAIRSIQALLDNLRLSTDQQSDYNYLSYEVWRSQCMGDLYAELRALWRDDILTGDGESWDRGSILEKHENQRNALKQQLKDVRNSLQGAQITTENSDSSVSFGSSRYQPYFDQGIALIEDILKADDNVWSAIGYLDSDEPGLALGKLKDSQDTLKSVASRIFYPNSEWLSSGISQKEKFEKLVSLPPRQRKEALISLSDELFYGTKVIFSGDSLGQEFSTGLCGDPDNWSYDSLFSVESAQIVKSPKTNGNYTTMRYCRYTLGDHLRDYTFATAFSVFHSSNSSVYEQQGGDWGKPLNGERIGIEIRINQWDQSLRLVVRSKIENRAATHEFVLEKTLGSEVIELADPIGITALTQGTRYEICLSATGNYVKGELKFGSKKYTLDGYSEAPEDGKFGIIASETIKANFETFSAFSTTGSLQLWAPPFFAKRRDPNQAHILSSANTYESHRNNLSNMGLDLATQPLVSGQTGIYRKQKLRGTSDTLEFPDEIQAVNLDTLDIALDACLSLTFYLRFSVIPIRMAQAYLLSAEYESAVELLHLLYDDTVPEDPNFDDFYTIYPFLAESHEEFDVDVGPDVQLMRLRLGEVYIEWARGLIKTNTEESRYKARLLYWRILKLHNIKDYCECFKPIGELIQKVAYFAKKQTSQRQNFSIHDAKKLITKISNIRHSPIHLQKVVNTILSVPQKDALKDGESWLQKAIKLLDLQLSEYRETIVSDSTLKKVNEIAEKLLCEIELELSTTYSSVTKGRYGSADSGLGSSSILSPHKVDKDIGSLFHKYVFCVPVNPLIVEQCNEACLMLEELSGCRNPIGLNKYYIPEIRFEALIQAALNYSGLAYSAERDLLNFRQSFEQESYSIMQAQQSLALSEGNVNLETYGVDLAASDISLAALQLTQSVITKVHYEQLLNTDLLMMEKLALGAAWTTVGLNAIAAIPGLVNAGVSTVGLIASATGVAAPIGIPAFLLGGIGLLGTAGSLTSVSNSTYQAANLQASYKRRQQDWLYQSNIARISSDVASQNLTQALQRYSVALERKTLAEMRRDFDADAVQFLNCKFLNGAMWVWMLKSVRKQYQTRLNYAISTSYLAERALAFEQLNPELQVIRFDYYDSKRDGSLGATQLQTDIATLQNLKLVSTKRKLQLSKTISLQSEMPAEFQAFKTGNDKLVFSTLMDSFDRDFPGHYLRLIKHVKITVLGLIPAVDGIHASLINTGFSKVVTGPPYVDDFKLIDIRRNPETIVLSSGYQASGMFVLENEYGDGLLLPFEGSGVAADWIFDLPKAANRFNYETIADVLITIEYTALESPTYRHQVIQKLSQNFSADRAYSFRYHLPDQWYHLNNPDKTKTENSVSFETQREDFPSNIDTPKIQHVTLYFATKDSDPFDHEVKLLFKEHDTGAPIGGEATPEENIISTFTGQGNADNWEALVNESDMKEPVGTWELILPNTEEVQNRFKTGDIEDILLVITFQGQTPPWPK